MADVEDTPVEATKDVGPSDEAQASDDVSLEEDETTFSDLEFDEEDEPASDSTETDKLTEEDESETEDEESDESDEPEQSDGEDTDPEEERKRFNAEMAQRRIAEKQARQEAEEAKKALEEERLQNYLAQAEGDDELLRERQAEVDAYNLKVQKAELNAEKLEIGIQRALADIDLFRTGSEAAKRQLLEAVDEFEANNIVKDNQGRPIEIRGDVYQTLVKKAESIKELTQAGAVQEAKTKQQAKARAITLPTRTPKAAKVDKDLEDFDKAWE